MADCGVRECPQFGSRDRTTGFGFRKSTGLRQMSTLTGRLTTSASGERRRFAGA
jgi:hypothetical protein